MLSFRIRLRQVQRHLRDEADPFNVPDYFFFWHYRMTKSCVTFIIEELTERCVDDFIAPSIPMYLKVLCALQFYGHGCFQKPTGMNYYWPLSQSSVSRCLQQVTDLICIHLTPTLVKFPITDGERNVVKQG